MRHVPMPHAPMRKCRVRKIVGRGVVWCVCVVGEWKEGEREVEVVVQGFWPGGGERGRELGGCWAGGVERVLRGC